MIEGLFWGCLLLLGYTYFGYPALVRLWAGRRGQPHRACDCEPTLSVVIVAFNEAEGIRRRLENLLALDYTPERVEIVLASDGSTDGTMNLARSYEGVGVTVIPFATRRGKAAVLNDVLPKVGGEIVVLADARQRFQAGALRALVKPFADQRVGAVSGELVLASTEGDTGVGEGVGFYWRYEKFIRKNESLVDSTVGATGAIYAIRRELFEPIPQDTILDDVLIPMRIARRGYRVVFEPTALAYDKTAATAREEFTRKVRTIAGNFQLFAREPWLLHPLRNRLWLQAVSHKGLRLITPILLLATMGANLLLLGHSFYRWTLMGQAFFYGAALGGYALREVGSKVPLLGVPYVLCLMNWATVVAFIRFIRGRQRATWEKAV